MVYLKHKLYMDFLDDPVNTYIPCRGLRDNTQHFRRMSPRHKGLYTRGLIDHIVYLVDSLRCIDIWACTIELQLL